MTRFALIICTCLIFTLLSACGGGGSSPTAGPAAPPADDTAQAPPDPEPEPTPDPEPDTETPDPDPADTGTREPEPEPDPEVDETGDQVDETGQQATPDPEPEPVVTLPPPTLSKRGSAVLTGSEPWSAFVITPTQSGHIGGTRSTYRFDNWGVWVEQDGSTIVAAYVTGDNPIDDPDNFRPDTYDLTIDGMPTGSNPSSGSATWTGLARGYDTSTERHGEPTEGQARFTVDFAATTIDAAITGFTGGQDDITYDDIPLRADGSFSSGFFGFGLDGRFYGDGHQAVAGQFGGGLLGEGIQGVFAATRQ